MNLRAGGEPPGGQINTQAWLNGDVNLPPGNPKAAGAKHAHGAPANDTVANADVSIAAGHADMARKAHGSGWATLSPNELASLRPNDPTLLGPRKMATNSPPQGPGGTGNKFFNVNPMTTFFMCFSKIQEAKKWLELVGTKLAVQQMKTINETGKEQASDTMKAGQAAYKSEMGQAWTSLGKAGLGVITFGMSAFSLGSAIRTAESELQQASKLGKEAEGAAAGAANQVMKETSRLTQNVTNKEQELNKLQQQTSIAEKFSSENEELTKISEMKDAKALAAKQQSSMEAVKDDATQSSSKRTSIELDQSKKETLNAQNQSSRTERQDQQEADQAGSAEKNQERSNKLQESISKDKSKMDKLYWKNQAAQQRSLEAGAKVESLTGGQYMKHLGELMNWNPANQLWQGLQGGLSSGLDALQHWFKGTGDLEQAYYNAKAQQSGTTIQILTTGLNSMAGLVDTNYKEANDVSDALTKMSDQEQSGMSWRG